jgi:hypothetical protein
MSPPAQKGRQRNTVTQERRTMAQIFTAVSILALAGLLWWRYGAQVSARWRQTAGSAGIERADLEHSARPIYRASAHEFLHGAADLTFGNVILALGFFMLM